MPALMRSLTPRLAPGWTLPLKWIASVAPVALVLFLGGMASAGLTGTISAQGVPDCPDLPESRLIIGDQGQVLAGSPNNLRLEPTTDSELLTTIPADERFLVLAGPVCDAQAGYAWWQVAYGEYVGWTVENVEDVYAVEPVETQLMEVNFGGVKFTLDSRVLSKVTGQVVPGSDPLVTDQPFWLQTPPFINFAPADDYDNPGTQAAIAVYPAQQLGEVQQTEALVNLQNLLVNPPANFTPDLLPQLPILGEERVLVSQIKQVDFNGGSGVRFVAYFSQSADPLTSGSLSYVFQGLTTQGEQYIQVYLPLTTTLFPSVLPADFDYDTFINDYDNYIASTMRLMNESSEQDFAPSLVILDAMVESFEVDPQGVSGSLNGDNTLTARCELIALADTRLRILPDVNAPVADYLPADVPVAADAQFIRRGERFPWWRLVRTDAILPLPDVPSLPGDRWLRADFTREQGNCSDLPVITNP